MAWKTITAPDNRRGELLIALVRGWLADGAPHVKAVKLLPYVPQWMPERNDLDRSVWFGRYLGRRIGKNVNVDGVNYRVIRRRVGGGYEYHLQVDTP